MRTKLFICTVVAFVAVIATPNGILAGQTARDATLTADPAVYVPTARDLAYNGVNAGDVAQVDIQSIGADLGFAGVVLNSDGVNPNAPHLFIKFQEENGMGFQFGACYLGFNGSAGEFGLGFFPLTQRFYGARMRASRSGSNVVIQLTDVNAGALPDQTYICAGAPAPVGDKIGIQGLHGVKVHGPRLDNFGDGLTVLDEFNFIGPFGPTGNWFDVVPGMHSHLLHFAEAGDEEHHGASMSFWKGNTRLLSIRPTSGAQGTTVNLRLTGLNFQAPTGSTVAVSGTGVDVKVKTDNYSTPTTLSVQLEIDPAAPTGTRNVTVTTPNGGTSAPLPFTVTGAPAACSASLPLTAFASAGTLNVTAGIGTTRLMIGKWVVGLMAFNPKSVSFYGTTLFSAILPAANPPMTRLWTTNVGSAPAVAVVNAFYNPYLCGFSTTWASSTSSAPYEPVSRVEVEKALRSIDISEFNGTYVEIPR